MSEFIAYSQSLMEAAKGFRTAGLKSTMPEVQQALYRSSLLHACSFLESHLNYMADHFEHTDTFSIHEIGILLEREVRFDRGKFEISKSLKISRITDRIDLLIHKFEKTKSTNYGWRSDLNGVLKIRNSLVHPKESHLITIEEISLA